MFTFLALAACGEAVEIEVPQVSSIRVEPAELTITTGPGGGEDAEFIAYGVYPDGREAVLDQVEWTLSNRSVGELEGGLFTASGNGGVSWVLAELAGLEGSATLTVLYEEERVEEGANKEAFLADGRGEASFWLYPEDYVNIPRNTPGITFMWSDIWGGASCYRLQISSEITDLVVYTSSTSWTADEETWQEITATNAGGSVEVNLAAAVGDTVYLEAPRHISVNRMDGRGSIVYWSTSAQGLMEIPYGEAARELITANTTGRCVACHTVSPQGQVAFTYDGGNGYLGVKDLDNVGGDILGYGVNIGNFHSFTPDGSLLVSVYNGVLQVFDGWTGVYMGTVDTGGYTVSHPDWSPDGTRLAVVLTGSHGLDWSFTGGRIAVMEHLGGGAFAPPNVLYAPTDGRNAYYPAFSPDGEWIAFNLSTDDSYFDPDATLAILASDGSAAPILLDRANQVGNLYNSMPKWGPLPDDEILWIAFSSMRTYGSLVSNRPQLWVAAVDPALARQLKDPSYPAFWLPNQDMNQNNHLPFWVER